MRIRGQRVRRRSFRRAVWIGISVLAVTAMVGMMFLPAFAN